MSRGRRAAIALGAVAAFGIGAFAYGVVIERNRFTVRRETLPILSPGAAPIRILHLSDLHMAPWQRGKQRWVRGLRRLHPDLVIETADVLGHADGLQGVMPAYQGFAGIPGVYVTGSNDRFGPTPRNPLSYFGGPSGRAQRPQRLEHSALVRFFDGDLGWQGLDNRATAMDINGTRLELFGTGDGHRDWDRLDALPDAIAALPPRSGAVRIGVTHAPYQRILNGFVQLGARLIVAGHTHGGQVRIPGIPIALVANCDLPRRQAQGVSSWTWQGRTATLEVSAGLGTSIYAPYRFACPPEAVLLTLTPAP